MRTYASLRSSHTMWTYTPSSHSSLLEKLRGVEEGAWPEARQHETGAMDRGLARARDVEFERGARGIVCTKDDSTESSATCKRHED